MILSIRNVSKQYATHKALDNVSFDVPAQSIFGLLGPNGAGKTTLIRIITQIISLDSGEITFKGEKLNPSHTQVIGYLPEERGLYKKMKVGEQLVYLARLKGVETHEAKKRIKYWVDKLGMQGWAEKNVEELSKGMQQKVQFVATVLHEPELIILDEPFTGFDPVNAQIIKNEILELRKKGATILFSTHRMESVEELCDNIVLINRSRKILEGKTLEIKRQYKNHSYKVRCSGIIAELPENMKILHENHNEHEREYIIQVSPTYTPNDLLRILLSQVEIHHFEENIPSVNDIFIQLVRGNTNS
ncbi:MAG: ATP-binding cassette domain-containing protein [Raineya sp.]|nr:ATP-binding cassette domain-containing protein [Raineya sp.]